jgi:predicted transcriptional regulator
LGNTEGIEQLLFDLASESRLGILKELSQNKLKMAEVARKLDLTATENFRQLQRLSEAKLVQKLPDGEYTLSEYGKLALHLLPALEFSYKNRDYLLTHNIWRLPYQFVNRIGELSNATLSMDTIENVNRAAHVVAEAEKYVWGLGDKALESIGPAMAQGMAGGVKFRFMFHESLLPRYKPLLAEVPHVEKRTLSEIPAMIFCTEKEAAICLHNNEGRMDYTGFFGKDPLFVNWVKELFEFYWEKAQRCIP